MTTPTRRERFRPAELLGLSAVVAVFVGFVVGLSSREYTVAVIFGVIAFIVSLLVFAMLALTTAPTGEERLDLDEQDRDAQH
jgi:uncharacterized membrane protein YjfL (UPF0719 family)